MLRRKLTIILTVLALPLLPGCNRGERQADQAAGASQEAGLPPVVARNRLRGVILGQPVPRPSFTLTTTAGEAFNFAEATRGKLTLLFFGYTHCPDVCPIHMANLGRVVGGLTSDIAQRITVVFVTTDPERDTPEHLTGWLANFHPGFIGLTGTPEEVRDAQLSLQLMPAAREVVDSTNPGAYLVSHAAQVFAFTSDDLAHIVYPFGIRQQDWANDLPILVEGWPE